MAKGLRERILEGLVSAGFSRYTAEKLCQYKGEGAQWSRTLDCILMVVGSLSGHFRRRVLQGTRRATQSGFRRFLRSSIVPVPRRRQVARSTQLSRRIAERRRQQQAGDQLAYQALQEQRAREERIARRAARRAAHPARPAPAAARPAPLNPPARRARADCPARPATRSWTRADCPARPATRSWTRRSMQH